MNRIDYISGKWMTPDYELERLEVQVKKKKEMYDARMAEYHRTKDSSDERQRRLHNQFMMEDLKTVVIVIGTISVIWFWAVRIL